jgi:hypothetical protein
MRIGIDLKSMGFARVQMPELEEDARVEHSHVVEDDARVEEQHRIIFCFVFICCREEDI